MDIVFQYPPELFQLLVDAIPLLCRSKNDVLLFFQGAGVGRDISADLAKRLIDSPTAVNKYEIARTILSRLNERGEPALRERREILRRVVQFEDFTTCWPGDQPKAKGYVSDIRRVVNVKDSFTRIDLERERERSTRVAEAQRGARDREIQREKVKAIQRRLLALFSESDKQKRGTALEAVLNDLFREADILVTDAFILREPETGSALEQIDGVIQSEGHHYLVEMKWWQEPLGVGEVSQHLVRVFSRGHARGLVISASGYTDPAIKQCKEALQKSVVVLALLSELVLILEREIDLKRWLKEKIDAAVVFKNPYHIPSFMA